MKNILLTIILTIPLFSLAQENPGCYVKKYFLILQSTKDYPSALQTAKNAAKSLKLDLDLRGLIPVKDTNTGLNLPVDSCLKYAREAGEEDPDSSCYMARGRYDDGIYVSIEYSNAIFGFAKGYYIVVAGSGVKADQPLVATLKKARAQYADAYLKASTVYVCCMH